MAWSQGSLLAMLLGFLLSGCTPGFRNEIRTMNDLPSSHVCVVGRVVIDPPLKKSDFYFPDTPPDQVAMYRKMNWLSVAPAKLKDEPSPGLDYWNGSIRATWDDLFFGDIEAGPQTLQMISYWLSFAVTGSRNIPGGYRGPTGAWGFIHLVCNLRLNIQAGDRVVYIGTLYLRRTKDHKLAAVEVRDDYDADLAAIRKRLGKTTRIRKVLAHKQK